jgi:hypothetical protein
MKKFLDAIFKLEVTEFNSVCNILLPLVLIYKDSYQNYIEIKLNSTLDEDEKLRLYLC